MTQFYKGKISDLLLKKELNDFKKVMLNVKALKNY